VFKHVTVKKTISRYCPIKAWRTDEACSSTLRLKNDLTLLSHYDEENGRGVFKEFTVKKLSHATVPLRRGERTKRVQAPDNPDGDAPALHVGPALQVGRLDDHQGRQRGLRIHRVNISG
jgi:hypothetical protein